MRDRQPTCLTNHYLHLHLGTSAAQGINQISVTSDVVLVLDLRDLEILVKFFLC